MNRADVPYLLELGGEYPAEWGLDLQTEHERWLTEVHVGRPVVVVNYPNPSQDHTTLRDIIGDWARTRPVGYVDLWARFEAKYTPEEWAERLGPNGHCNALGYREMADRLGDARAFE